MLEIGQPAPGFSLLDQEQRQVSWDQFRGRPVVVFFYPRANTSGCTKEACSFRDLRDEFDQRGVAVVGISADTVTRQANWTAKYDLTMPLLADTERQVIEPWGVWAEKKMYGRTSMGIVRSTFLFDADGLLLRAWHKVKVAGHVEAVLAAIDEVGSA